MDSCSAKKCRQKKLTFVKQLRRDLKQRDKQKKQVQRKFKNELNKLKRKRKSRQSAINRAVRKLAPQDRRKFLVYDTPSKIIVARQCACRKRFFRLFRAWYCYAGVTTAIALALVLGTAAAPATAYSLLLALTG